MEKRRRIVVYGNSVIMGALRATMLRRRGYEVISLLPSQQDRLEGIAPDVVLFDLDNARPEMAFSLMESCRGLMLIGIGADDSVVKVWSGRVLRELSTRDLMELIDQAEDVCAHLPEQLCTPEMDSMNGCKEKKRRMTKISNKADL